MTVARMIYPFPMLQDGLTAIDDDRLSNDVSGGVRAKPQDSAGDLLRACSSTGRHIAEDLLPTLGRAASEALHHRRVDITGAYRVHADVLCRVVERRRLREADHPELRRAIAGLAGDAFDRGAGPGVHDHSTTTLQHWRDLVLHAQEHAAKIDLHQPLELVI